MRDSIWFFDASFYKQVCIIFYILNYFYACLKWFFMLFDYISTKDISFERFFVDWNWFVNHLFPFTNKERLRNIYIQFDPLSNQLSPIT